MEQVFPARKSPTQNEMTDAPTKFVDRFSPTQIAVMGFGVALVTLLVLATVQYRAIQSLAETDAWVAHTDKVLFEIEAFFANLTGAESANYNYVMTGDEHALHQYHVLAANAGDLFRAIRHLTSDNPQQQRNLDRYEPLVQRKLELMQDLIRMHQEQGVQPVLAALRQGEGKGLMAEIYAGVEAMTGEERSLLENRQAASQQHARDADITVALGTIFALLLVTGVTTLLILSSHERRKAQVDLQRQAEKLNELAELVELARDAIFIRDLNGLITYWNQGAARTYGWRKEESMGRVAYDLLKTEFPIPLKDIEKQTLSHDSWEGELIQTSRDGRRVILDSRWVLVRDNAGNPKAILEINHDVTERQQLEAKFRGLLESAPDAIVVAGMDGRIALVNAQTERLFGYPRQELLQQSVELLVPEGFRGEHHGNWANLFHEARTRSLGASLEFYGRRKDGTEFPLEISLSPFGTGTETLVSSGIRDVTDRKRIESGIRKLNAELEKRGADLEATNRELETFAYSVSHDLRAPLRAIDGFSQVLMEDHGEKLDAEGRNCLSRVRAATQRMGELIDCLLGLARLNRQEVQRSNVDLSAVAGAIAENLRQNDPSREVDFVIAPGAQAQGDRRLLEVALQNLLANAWKFTGKSPHARIEFGVSGENGKSIFFVRDNGAGFDMAYAGKLFGTFQRLHAQGEFEGHGIGLATVRRVINRHGGRIWAEGQVGKGATFSFTL